MQMIRRHIKKCDTERKKSEKVDLDEKIRRIREENKVREKRFKEIEADKIQASASLPGIKDVRSFKKERSSENEQGIKREIKGVSVTSERKMAKGRGQRLLEMSKEPLKARDFASKARQPLKTFQEKSNKERLKAKDFELMARQSLKTAEEKTHPNEMKLSSNTYLITENKNTCKPKKVEYFTNQGKFKEKNDLSLCSGIPSSGYINPLLDDRYLDKPKKRGTSNFKDKWSDGNNAGFQSWNKDTEIKGKETGTQKDKGGRFYEKGQKDHTRSHKEALTPGSTSGRENDIRQENTSEDRSLEVINLDEDKMEPIIDAKLVVTELPYKELEAHEEETEINLHVSEDAKIKDKNNTGFNEWGKPQLDKIPEVCQSFTEPLPTVLQNDEDGVQNEKVPPNKETKKELDMSTEVTAPVLQNNYSSKEQETPSEDITKSKGKENRPKVTVNTKLKKTLSTSSFEDGMSLLSPLDVPTNWGDLDFNDDENVVEATHGVFLVRGKNDKN